MCFNYKILTKFCFFFIALSINSQVTIGSLNEPVKGSILDIKQFNPDNKNITAKAGILLPRVELKSPTELSFSDFTISDDLDEGGQKLKHTGMIVYNVNETLPFKKGIYVWSGSEWLLQE